MEKINQRELKYVKVAESGKILAFHYGYDGGVVYPHYQQAGVLAIPKGWNNDNYASSYIPCDMYGNEIEIFSSDHKK